VLGPTNLVVRSGERVAITGANGSGKTTLLRLASGTLTPSPDSVRRTPGRFPMLDQHVAFIRDDETMIEATRRMSPDLSMNECHTKMAQFAFRNFAADKRCDALSGGERVRAGHAGLLFAPEPPALLLTDEPTNHMDIDSVEALEAGLRGTSCWVEAAANHRAETDTPCR